jgi:pilus assembly protein Flp/PilA
MLLDLYVRTKVWLAEVPPRVRDRFTDETGAVSAEYGLLIVLIALVMAIGATFLGSAIMSLFNKTGSSVNK